MALIPVQDGPQMNFVAPSLAGGDTFKNDGTPFVSFFINDANPRTLTVRNPHPGCEDWEWIFLPPGGSTPRFDPLFWNDPVTNQVLFEFDDPVGVVLYVSRTNVVGIDPDLPPLPGLS